MSTPTNISKLIDWLTQTVVATFPDHQELLDPDDLTNNPLNILAAGFSVSVGDGRNSQRCLEQSAYYYLRTFTVILTRDFVSQQSDVDTRTAKQKLLMEDLNAMIQPLVGSWSIPDPIDPTKLISFSFAVTRDSGPRLIEVEDLPHGFIELTLTAEYRELKT